MYTLPQSDIVTIIYQNGQVETFVTESSPVPATTAVPATSSAPNRSGEGLQSAYKGIVELGYQFGLGDYGTDRIKLDMINGYQIKPYLSLGVGTGLRYYFFDEALLIPLFADFRVNFTDNHISPYLSLGVGYSFDATNSFEGAGFLLNPTVGACLKISNKSVINVGLGYEMQRMQFYRYFLHRVHTENSGALSLVVGISF